ncbi:hypothetical protein DPMN_159897 [Dreissena polymorpha]|uniref:F5/8 type C domain-containing protein n=1 Tax=Dreissena polymorpha TaxID=45954 RepID=A0A9D4IN97_DREPO|nr:hypothetical protein DPMN_159897 [Dreissena polymorpha]
MLEENISRSGFVATASAVTDNRIRAYGAFNSLNADASNGSWATPAKKGWLQIKCPRAVIIWRVALNARAINGNNITAWEFSESNVEKTFTTLLTSQVMLLGSAIASSFFDISTTTAYQYYRLNITASSDKIEAPLGVQVMQLYVLTTG